MERLSETDNVLIKEELEAKEILNEAVRVRDETLEALVSVVSFFQSIDTEKIECTLKSVLEPKPCDPANLIIVPRHEQKTLKNGIEKLIVARDKFNKSEAMVQALAEYQGDHFRTHFEEMVKRLEDRITYLEKEHTLIEAAFLPCNNEEVKQLTLRD